MAKKGMRDFALQEENSNEIVFFLAASRLARLPLRPQTGPQRHQNPGTGLRRRCMDSLARGFR